MPSKPGGKKSAGPESAPVASRKSTKQPAWGFPPLAWMLAACQGTGTWKPPSRLLVCGAIPEIGPLAKNLPDCEVVVLERSPEQVRALRTACSRRRIKNTRIETGLADQEALSELIGGNFDLVLAPGVFRGVESIERAFDNLAACTAKEGGGLYLELDTPNHPACRAAEIQAHHPGGKDEALAAKLVLIASGVSGLRPPLPSQNQDFSSRCWPLLKWLGLAAGAGLRPVASTLPARLLPLAVPYEGMAHLGGLDLVSLCCLLETMAAPSVLQVLFTRRPFFEPPWDDTEALSGWRPCVQFWPRDKVPPMEAPFTNYMEIGVEIPALLELQKLQVTAFLLEFLRLSNGISSIARILEAIPHPAKIGDVSRALHFFHHTSILRLLPPE